MNERERSIKGLEETAKYFRHLQDDYASPVFMEHEANCNEAIKVLKQYENLEERHATMVDAADKLYAELRSRPQIIYCEECAFFDGQDGSETHSRCRLRNCDTNGLEFCSRATRKKEN